MIFVGVVAAAGNGGVAGVPFCRWLPPLVVSDKGQPVGTGSVLSRANAAATWVAQGQER